MKIQYTVEFEDKVRRWIAGMLADYGKPLDELSPIRKTFLESDVQKLANGLLYEAEKEVNRQIEESE
jgi:hypothetical protein